MARHGGVFPADPALLAELPGIGRSTAAAITAFAWGTRAAILDGNVKRVFARAFGIAELIAVRLERGPGGTITGRIDGVPLHREQPGGRATAQDHLADRCLDPVADVLPDRAGDHHGAISSMQTWTSSRAAEQERMRPPSGCPRDFA